jgi:hypothetical protein
LKSLSNEQKIFYTVQIASVMCFIGHGSFGIITKPIWCNYFAVFGIGYNMAYHLMPVLGSVDILLGLTLLFYPTRAIALWLVIWGLLTASLRPLSGEPFAELIERAGNFGAPLVLLLLSDTCHGFNAWSQKIGPPASVSPKRLKTIYMCLRITAFLLLAGHGWLNLLDKKGLIGNCRRADYSASPFKASFTYFPGMENGYRAVLPPLGII